MAQLVQRMNLGSLRMGTGALCRSAPVPSTAACWLVTLKEPMHSCDATPPQRSSRSFPLRRPIAALASLCALLALSVMGSLVPARGQTDPAKIIATFKATAAPPGYSGDYTTQELSMFAEPGTRRLYVYGPVQRWLVAYSLDSLAPLAPGLVVPDAGTVTAALPDHDGSLFMAFSLPGSNGSVSQFTVTPAGTQRLSTFSLPSLANREVWAMYRAPRSPYLWLLSAAFKPTGETRVPGLRLTQVDLRDNTNNWNHDVPAETCPYPLHEPANWFPNTGLGLVDGGLYFGCASPRYPFAGPSAVPPPITRGVGRLDLVEENGELRPGEFSIFTAPADLAAGNGFFDPGSGRFVVIGYSPATNGTAAFVFDASRHRYVGGIAIQADQASGFAMGFNSAIGRFYAIAPNGLTGADIRATPPQQGYRAKGFEFDPQVERSSSQPSPVFGIVTDPRTGRFFIRYANKNTYVVQDNVPPFVEPSRRDPDANTVDIPEEAGKTEATYSGGAQGYGASYKFVGGTHSLLANTINIDTSSIPLTSGTRELRTAYLNRLRLTNGEASAGAITAMPDDGESSADLARTTPRNPDTQEPLTHPDPNDPSDREKDSEFGQLVNWPYQGASCADFGDDPSDATAGDAKVACNVGTKLAMGDAVSRATDVGAFSVERSEFSSRSIRDPKRGVVTNVTSVAKGVAVAGGLLHIGEVHVSAVASANGRKGGASVVYERTVRDVFLDGQRLCDDRCDVDAISETINNRLVGRVHVEFPEVDAVATKGGYQAVIRRHPIDQQEEVFFNEQRSDRIEVPAMVISVIQDNIKPLRMIGQFAAVQAEATYGISRIGAVVDDVDDHLLDAIADSVNGPVFGGGTAGGDGGGAGFGAVGGDGASLGGDAGGLLSRPGRFIVNGVRLAAQLLPIWAVLLIPVYLSARRWLLLQRARLTQGVRQ